MSKKLNKLQEASKDATGFLYEDGAPEAAQSSGAGVPIEDLSKDDLIQLLNQSRKILEQQAAAEQAKAAAEAEKKPTGRPTERGETYRFSLYLDIELANYAKHIARKNKQPLTQYLNELVRRDMEAYISAGGNADEWTDKD